MARLEKTGCLRHASRFAHGSLYSGGGLDICRTTKLFSETTPKELEVKVSDRGPAYAVWLKLKGGLRVEGGREVTFLFGLGQVDRELVHLCFAHLSGTRCSPTLLAYASSSPPPHHLPYFPDLYILECLTNHLR